MLSLKLFSVKQRTSIFALLFLVPVISFNLVAATTGNGNLAAKFTRWQGIAPKIGDSPKLTAITGPDAVAGFRVAPVSAGKWQGVKLPFTSPLAIAGRRGITFYVRQQHQPSGRCYISLLDNQNRCFYRDFRWSGHDWQRIELPFTPGTWQHNNAPTDVMPQEIVLIRIYSDSIINQPGNSMEIADLRLPSGETESDADKPVANKVNLKIATDRWQGHGPKGSTPPELLPITGPDMMPGFRINPLNAGKWRGAGLTFTPPLSTSGWRGLAFYVRQQSQPSSRCYISLLDNRNRLFYRDFRWSGHDWQHIELSFAPGGWHYDKHPTNLVPEAIVKIKIYSDNIIDQPGNWVEIADFQLLPGKTLTPPPAMTKLGALKPARVEMRTLPSSGSRTPEVLIDGKVESANQPVWGQYTSNPELVFDFGGEYFIKSVAVSAIAVPSQNISELVFSISPDGRNWTPAGRFDYSGLEAEEQRYELVKTDLNAIGRYLRITAGRSRVDFLIRIAEVAFTGKTPTIVDRKAVAAQSYYHGPPLAAVNDQNYYTLASGDCSLRVNKSNGVATQLHCGQELVAERLLTRYELTNGSSSITADSYGDQVIAVRREGDALTLELKNPKMPGLRFSLTYRWEGAQLIQRLAWQGTPSDQRYILFLDREVVLAQSFRAGGLYESWGSGHTLEHRFASEILCDTPADTAAVVVFEQPRRNTTLLDTRYRYNDEYIHIGSGNITIAGFGNRRTRFTPIGWINSVGIYEFNADHTSGSVESRLLIADGDLTAAFDRYLELPEVRRYHAAIYRPDWIKDTRMLLYKSPIEWYHHMLRDGNLVVLMENVNFRWGELPTTGTLRGLYGAEYTVDELKAKYARLRAAVPAIKLVEYTWLASAMWNSEVVKQHPEWFITRNKQGQELCFFPQMAMNFYRLVGTPESRDYVIKQIVSFVRGLGQDLWYLDGGGSPSVIDWATLQLDPPNSWDKLNGTIRKELQHYNPECALFFNNPENPLGDFGYMESHAGVFSKNWRTGATWMYRFKLWQRHDPLFTPLYLYWVGGADQSFRYYVVGTGLALTTNSHPSHVRDIAYASAYQQSRWGQLVDAKVQPNWRYTPDEQLEGMVLRLGNGGWCFMYNHSSSTLTRRVSFTPAALGFKPECPVYNWRFDLKPVTRHLAIAGEREAETGYREGRWQSDFISEPHLLGLTKYDDRLEQEFHFQPGACKLWMVTQSPALVYSVDHLRNQLWLSETLGVKVAGEIKDNRISLLVHSSRKTAEILTLIPTGKLVTAATINGAELATTPIFTADTSCALFAVPAGHHRIELTLTAAPIATSPVTVAIDVTPAAPGGTLCIRLQPPQKKPVALSVVGNGDLVWCATGDQAAIKLPKTLRGGKYTVLAHDMAGHLLGKESFTLTSGCSRYKLPSPEAPLPLLQQQSLSTPVALADGAKIIATATLHHPEANFATATSADRTLSVGTARQLPRATNTAAAALELTNVKRYLKIRLRGNFDYYVKEGPRPGCDAVAGRYRNDSALALILDFGSIAGYTRRTALGLGYLLKEFNSKAPAGWGTKRPPEYVASLSDFLYSGLPEEIYWLDLKSFGSPTNWNGQLWCSLLMQHFNPNRRCELTLLETAATLPPGAKVSRAVTLRGTSQTAAQVITVPQGVAPKLDGRLTEPAWQQAAVIRDFYRFGRPSAVPPPTEFRIFHDGAKLYCAAIFTEGASRGFISSFDKPWYNDSAEFYFQTPGNTYTQYIIDTGGHVWACHQGLPGTVAPVRKLANPEFGFNIQNDKLIIEAAFPLTALTPTPRAEFGCNFGRNRAGNELEHYSAVPGSKYLNFSALKLKLR